MIKHIRRLLFLLAALALLGLGGHRATAQEQEKEEPRKPIIPTGMYTVHDLLDPAAEPWPFTIIMQRAFAPMGQVNPAGKSLALGLVGEVVPAEPGDRIVLNVTVTQGSGAQATGQWVTVAAFRPSDVVHAHTTFGSRPFVPGLALATGQATLMGAKGEVKRTWTWTSVVRLQ
jgi:hypothetical protein